MLVDELTTMTPEVQQNIHNAEGRYMIFDKLESDVKLKKSERERAEGILNGMKLGEPYSSKDIKSYSPQRASFYLRVLFDLCKVSRIEEKGRGGTRYLYVRSE